MICWQNKAFWNVNANNKTRICFMYVTMYVNVRPKKSEFFLMYLINKKSYIKKFIIL